MSGITGSCNIKNEQRQVYLFDHRILIAMPADRDGFYEHQMDIKVNVYACMYACAPKN